MKKLLFSLYGFSFFNKFLLLTPVYSIFMLANGLTDFQLSTMFIVSAIGTIAAQAPVTYLTNHLGQRWAMIVGQSLKMVAILLWLVVPSYIGFFIGMVLWGGQAGFRSVAFEGLLYDSVSAYGLRRDYSRILGRKATYESIGVALSAFGSLLMFLGYAWVTFASVAAIAVSIVCLLLVPYRSQKTPGRVAKTNLIKILRTGFRICMQTPCLLSFMLLALLAGNIPFLDDFLSPIGLQLGMPTEYVGMIPLFLLGCAMLGQRFAYRFSNAPDRVLYWLIGLVGIAYTGFGFIYTIDALWILGIAYILFYGIYTLLYSKVQHMIPPRYRSVVLSLYTTINYILYMVVCGIIGLGGTLGSWRYSIMILGGLMLAVCVWALLSLGKRCKISLGE